MITNKSGYRKVNVNAITVDGSIIPRLESYGQTPKEIRAEDIAFLNEALAQRGNAYLTTIPNNLSITRSLIDAIKSHIVALKGENYFYPTSVANFMHYLNGFTIPSGFFYSYTSISSIRELLSGTYGTLLSEGISTGSEILKDDIRRFYGDIFRFCNGFVGATNSSYGGTASVSGSGTYDVDDPRGSEWSGHASGTYSGKSYDDVVYIDDFSIRSGFWYYEAYLNAGRVDGLYQKSHTVGTSTPSSYTITTGISNASSVYCAFAFYARTYNTASGYDRYGTCYKFIPINGSIHSAVSTSTLNAARQFMGIQELVNPGATTTRTSAACEMYAYPTGMFVFSVRPSWYTAEVDSLGWRY